MPNSLSSRLIADQNSQRRSLFGKGILLLSLGLAVLIPISEAFAQATTNNQSADELQGQRNNQVQLEDTNSQIQQDANRSQQEQPKLQNSNLNQDSTYQTSAGNYSDLSNSLQNYSDSEKQNSQTLSNEAQRAYAIAAAIRALQSQIQSIIAADPDQANASASAAIRALPYFDAADPFFAAFANLSNTEFLSVANDLANYQQELGLLAEKAETTATDNANALDEQKTSVDELQATTMQLAQKLESLGNNDGAEILLTEFKNLLGKPGESDSAKAIAEFDVVASGDNGAFGGAQADPQVDDGYVLEGFYGFESVADQSAGINDPNYIPFQETHYNNLSYLSHINPTLPAGTNSYPFVPPADKDSGFIVSNETNGSATKSPRSIDLRSTIEVKVQEEQNQKTQNANNAIGTGLENKNFTTIIGSRGLAEARDKIYSKEDLQKLEDRELQENAKRMQNILDSQANPASPENSSDKNSNDQLISSKSKDGNRTADYLENSLLPFTSLFLEDASILTNASSSELGNGDFDSFVDYLAIQRVEKLIREKEQKLQSSLGSEGITGEAEKEMNRLEGLAAKLIEIRAANAKSGLLDKLLGDEPYEPQPRLSLLSDIGILSMNFQGLQLDIEATFKPLKLNARAASFDAFRRNLSSNPNSSSNIFNGTAEDLQQRDISIFDRVSDRVRKFGKKLETKEIAYREPQINN